LQRDVQVARWVLLTGERLPAQVAPAVLTDGRRAAAQHLPSGINAATRELGIDQRVLERKKNKTACG